MYHFVRPYMLILQFVETNDAFVFLRTTSLKPKNIYENVAGKRSSKGQLSSKMSYLSKSVAKNVKPENEKGNLWLRGRELAWIKVLCRYNRFPSFGVLW